MPPKAPPMISQSMFKETFSPEIIQREVDFFTDKMHQNPLTVHRWTPDSVIDLENMLQEAYENEEEEEGCKGLEGAEEEQEDVFDRQSVLDHYAFVFDRLTMLRREEGADSNSYHPYCTPQAQVHGQQQGQQGEKQDQGRLDGQFVFKRKGLTTSQIKNSDFQEHKDKEKSEDKDKGMY